MRAGVSSRGSTWVSMGCFGWLIVGPFILAGYALAALWQLLAAGTRAVTGAVRDARPEPAAWQLERRARRRQAAGVVILCLCGLLAFVVLLLGPGLSHPGR